MPPGGSGEQEAEGVAQAAALGSLRTDKCISQTCSQPADPRSARGNSPGTPSGQLPPDVRPSRYPGEVAVRVPEAPTPVGSVLEGKQLHRHTCTIRGGDIGMCGFGARFSEPGSRSWQQQLGAKSCSDCPRGDDLEHVR